MKDNKTNVMRILDKEKIEYLTHSYVNSSVISGKEVAEFLNQNPDRVFKTLVTIGNSNQHYVFLVPVNNELNLKKAAKSVNEKSVEMIKSKDLMSLTGYIHGGCSPIGMKKYFKTVINSNAENFSTIIFSAGKIGFQVEMNLDELKKVIEFKLEDIVD